MPDPPDDSINHILDDNPNLSGIDDIESSPHQSPVLNINMPSQHSGFRSYGLDVDDNMSSSREQSPSLDGLLDGDGDHSPWAPHALSTASNETGAGGGGVGLGASEEINGSANSRRARDLLQQHYFPPTLMGNGSAWYRHKPYEKSGKERSNNKESPMGSREPSPQAFEDAPEKNIVPSKDGNGISNKKSQSLLSKTDKQNDKKAKDRKGARQGQQEENATGSLSNCRFRCGLHWSWLC